MDIFKEEEIKQTVLIVDDTPRVRQALNYLFTKKNYKTLLANDGKQAVEMVNNYLPDLILLDVMMPEMDGFSVCKKIKEHSETRDIPVIFLTAKTSSADIMKGFDSGAVDYVKKPYNTTELLARVDTHLELKKIKDREKNLKKALKAALGKFREASKYLPYCSICKKKREREVYFEKAKKYCLENSDDLECCVCWECEGG